MNKSIEITPQERARLGRDTMLQWSIKENKAKLKALKKEIGEYLKSGATDKLEKLRQTIIQNTRKDLEKIKDLTNAQRDKKAREFADKVIRYVKENKDLNDVFFTSRVEMGPEGQDKNDKAKLLDQWVNNNPKGDVEILEDDPKYLALKEIYNDADKKAAFILLGLIDRFHGGRDVAMDLYKKAKKGDKIDLDILRARFTKEKAKSTVGFYYGVRKVMWNFGKWTTDERQRKRIEDAGYKCEHVKDPHSGTTDAFLVYVKGWWAWDAGEDNDNYFNNDEYEVDKGFLNKLRSGGGYGDEFMGKNIHEALTHRKNNLLKELHKAETPGERDSGLSRDKEGEVRQALVDLKKASENMYDSKVLSKVLLWFKKHPNKWVTLEYDKEFDKNIFGQMQFLFGQGVGLFKYRYVPDKKRIFFIRIQGAQLHKDWGKGGEIIIEKGKIVKKWNSYGMDETKEMLKKEVIEDMKAEDIKKEVASNKVNAAEGTKAEKLSATSGIVYKLRKKLPKNVEHSKLKEGYIDVLEKRLKKYLLDHDYKNKEELAEELALLRVEHVKKEIENYIEDNAALKKAVEENDKEKITISIDSSDEVKVELFDKKTRNKWRKWAKDKIEGAKTTAGDIAEGTMARLEKKLSKYFGPLTPVVMWVLDWVFKIGDAFKKMAKGGKSLIGGLLTSFLGIKVLKDKLKSKKITEEVIEKLPPKKKKFYKFDKKMYFSEDVKLKKKKIVIPSGKGIKPGKEFEVNVKGVRDPITVKPIEAKKTGILARIFGSRSKEKYRLSDSEIIIPAGTTIPKDTVIPKGAKIYKV